MDLLKYIFLALFIFCSQVNAAYVSNPAIDRTTASGPFSVRQTDGTSFYDSRQIRPLTTSDQVTATISGTIPVSIASIPLASGAATSALQTSGNSVLSNILSALDVNLSTRAADRTTAASPFSFRLSDGTSFYKPTTPSDTQPISAASLPLPTGAATESTLSFLNGKIPTSPSQEHTTAGSPTSVRISTGAAFVDPTQIRALTSSDVVTAILAGIPNVSVSSSVLPTGAATSANQTTANTSLSAIQTSVASTAASAASIDSKITTTGNGIKIDIQASILPTGASTSGLQTSGNSSLSSILSALDVNLSTRSSESTLSAINNKTPALGQSLAASSTPVVLTAAQILTLTPRVLSTATDSISVQGVVSGSPVNVLEPLDIITAGSNITAQDTGSTTTTQFASQTVITGTPSTNSSVSLVLSSIQTIMIDITGTWTGTLSIEISSDNGITWQPRSVHVVGTAIFSSSITSNVVGSMNASAKTNVRVRATTAMTGTAIIKFVESDNSSNMYIANSLKIIDSVTPLSSTGLSIKAASTLPAFTDTAAVVTIRDTVTTKTALTFNTPASGTISTTSTQLFASNANRKGLFLVNSSVNIMSCAVGTTALASAGIVLYPGGVWNMNEYSFATGAINCIGSAAGTTWGGQEMQ